MGDGDGGNDSHFALFAQTLGARLHHCKRGVDAPFPLFKEYARMHFTRVTQSNEEYVKSSERAAGVRGLISAVPLLVLLGCASSVAGRTPPATAVANPVRQTADSTDVAPPEEAPVVQVREYSHSPTVSVVAWTPDASAYGLRATVRRDGTLIQDHTLYVSTYYGNVSTSPYVSAVYLRQARGRGFVTTVVPEDMVLLSTGILRDVQACYGWPKCSPYETRGVRVHDSVLRANRDSLAVRFYGSAGSELIITVYRDLIDPYLATVDSVSAALRKH
jgi:hypothetical protein